MSRRRTSLLLAVWLSALGCASAGPTPTDAVAAYAAALREGRYPDAWRLLSGDARRTIPYDDFERAAREHPDEARDTAAALEGIDPRAPVTARLELDSGEAVTLVEEGGRWRLDPSALEFYGQHTPRQALRSFVRALTRQRWDVLLRLAPRSLAVRMTAQDLRASWGGRDADAMQQTLQQLGNALARERAIEVAGERATMTYGTGGHAIAQLVREDGLWKIERLE